MPKEMGPVRRSFTVVASSTGAVGGRYINANPYGAAGKAARKLFTISREGHMQLQEITRGSAGKMYWYASIIERINKMVMFKGADGVAHEIMRKFMVRVVKLTEVEYTNLGVAPGAAARHFAKKKMAGKSLKRKAPVQGDDGGSDSATDTTYEEGSQKGGDEGDLDYMRGGNDMYHEDQMMGGEGMYHEDQMMGGGMDTYY